MKACVNRGFEQGKNCIKINWVLFVYIFVSLPVMSTHVSVSCYIFLSRDGV